MAAHRPRGRSGGGATSSEPSLDREQLRKSGDLEDSSYSVGRMTEHEPMALRFDALLRLHEQAESGRVDEVETTDVDHQGIAALMREIDERAPQRRRGAELKVSADGHDCALLVVLNGERDGRFH